MAGFVSARDVDELRAIALTLSSIERPVRRAVDRATRAELGAIWKPTVQANATTARDTALIAAGVSVKAGNPAILQAATSRRKVRGTRLVPAEHWAGQEYGADHGKVSRYTRKSRNGGTHPVQRHTQRHLPRRRRQGRVLAPAVADTLPRLMSLWTQIVVRTVMDAAEGKR